MKLKTLLLALIISMLCLIIPTRSNAQTNEFQLIAYESESRLDVGTALLFFDNKDAVTRFREVELNDNIKSLSAIKTDDRIILNLFPDTRYIALVHNVESYFEDNVTITARLESFDYAFTVISTTTGRTLINIFIPEQGKRFEIISDPVSFKHYLIELNPALIPEVEDQPALMSKDDASEEDFIIPPRTENTTGSNKGTLTDVTIDIMILYTPAARTWGNNNGGGILNCVATAVAIGKTVHTNSQTYATNRLVYTAEVSYTESGDPELDLNRLTGTSDGYIDGIHTWRNTYGADLVQLFTTMGGGIGWLLGNTSGDPGGGFSCVGVSTSSAFSPIHEMGHNMGCGHHKQQNFQPGPGIYSYSAGWRWVGSDGVLYSSAMSYTDGSYFPPGYQSSTRVGYFSNPTINFMGAATGDYDDGDNAWTIENTKSVIAAYRATATINCITCPGYDFEITPVNSWNTHSSSVNLYGCKMYRFEVSTGRTYTFQTGCGNGATANFDTYLNLYDSNCADVTYNDDGCESSRSKITWMATYDGYAYLKVKGYNEYFGSYTLAYQKSDELTWQGDISTNWNTAGNWNGNVVPDATFDVTIPTGAVRQPYIQSANAICKSLTIYSGATLTVGGYALTVQNDFSISGTLNVNNTAGLITTYGNVSWNSGSTAGFTTNSAFNVYGTWEFNSGSNANLANGVVAFRGTSSYYIRSYSATSSFNNVSSYKSGGAETGISSWSTQPLTINGDIYVHPGAKFGIFSDYDLILKGDVNSNGIFICNAGKVVLDGVSQDLRMNVGDYFRNLTFSQTGTVTVNNTLSSILDVNGNVIIQSGVFNLSDRTMKVSGDWTNSMGTSGFTEGTSRVIFDGPGHQYIKSNETFNILEANMGAALRIDYPGYNVSCNQYDWTSGGIDVIAGTFTALDLTDSGLFGTFWCNPAGAINLTQDAGQYTDLHGEIHIFGGNMTVTGGWGQSFWPYLDNATIEMSGGVLNFVNNGIYIYNGGNSLTENITGGTIKTNGSFTGDRADFTPSGGTIELYGTNDIQLSHGVGSNFDNLLINKSASTDNSGNDPEEILYDRKGNPIENSRSNVVTAASNLVLLGNMTIQNGQLTAPSSIKLKGNWTNNVGTAGFTEGTSTVTFDNDDHQYCYGETFYTLELNMSYMDLHIPAGTTTSCQVYDWNSGELEVEGGTFIAYDLLDSGIFGKYYLTADGGLIELHQDLIQFVDLCGRITIVNGTMNVYGGNGYSYWPFSTNGAIWMSGGILDFKDNGIQVNNSALSLDDQISGGTIRVSKGFYGNRSDFTPTDGLFEFYGSSDYTISQSNGCTLHDMKINKSAKDAGAEPSGKAEYDERSGLQISDGGKSNTITLGSNFTVTGNLEISAGTFNLNTFTCNVTGTTDIYGTLAMTNAGNDLTSGTINWNAGSTDNVTAGTFHAHNWLFNDGTNAKLGTGNTAYIYNLYYPTDDDAEFGNLVAVPFSKLSNDEKGGKAYFPIRVMGNFTAQASANWYFQFEATDLLVAGNSIIENTAVVEFSQADYSNTGSLTLNGSLILWSGSVAIVDGDFIFPSTGVLNVGPGTFTNNYNTGSASLSGNLRLTTGVVEFPNRTVSIFSTFNDQISGGIFRVGKTLSANTAGTFQPLAGTVEFVNASSGNYVQVTNGNYLYNMVLNKPGSSFQVYDNLTIKGSLFIDGGVLNSNNKTISIGGDWYNNVGVSAFAETNGRVIFNGTGNQFCKTEDFYTLEVNNPGGLLYNVAEHNISCQIYDWTSGGLWISPGNFSAADLADDGLFGTYAIYNGTMDLHQDINQYVDLNGSLFVGSGGILNVYGGHGESWWPFSGNASITMNGGVLDFKDVAIYINPSLSYTFTENITGGNIRTTRNFSSNNAAFTPSGGSVELYGNLSTGIYNNAGSYFNDVTINKSLASDKGPVNYIDREGKSVTFTRGDNVIMTGNVVVNGDLSVNSGKLYSGNAGYALTCMGNVNIENTSTLELGESSQLKLNNTLSIKSGGTFISSGTLGNEVLVTRVGVPYYSFSVESGGNLSANNTIFEYMGVNGINVKSGAFVDPSNAFNYCTFQNGASGQTLLMVNNDQELECTGAEFPNNTWSGFSNVTKWVNQGRITFYDYSGGFAGPGFEQDLFDRVDWFTPALSASPLILNVNPPAGSITFDITSNVDWTISESLSWVQVTPMSGSNNATITINYTRNSSASARSGIITISAAGVPDVTVTINQAGATLAVTPAYQSVSAAAGTTSFGVNSNTIWTVSESTSWFTVAPAGGTGNNTLTVTYDQNGSVSSRSGQITVSSTGLPNVVVTVNQAGAGATLTVLPANRDVPPEAGTTTFNLTSNTGWTVSESVSWFSVLPASGTGNGTLTVTYGENASGTSRIGNITVTATGGVPVVTVTVTQASYPTQNIMLTSGWTGLSSYIMPVNNDIADVFAPVDYAFVIAQTMSGVYYPAGPLNTIGDWLSQSAYKIKMSNQAVLPVIGNIELNKAFALSAGWNLMPVICNTNVTTSTLVSGLGANLNMIKEIAGSKVYWPAYGIYTLNQLTPGKAYFVRMGAAGSVTFPANVTDNLFVPDEPVKELATPWNEFHRTPASHIVGIDALAMAGLHEGDIIGVFTPEGLCSGNAQIESLNENHALYAFADDQLTTEAEGFTDGQPMIFKLFRPSTKEEFSLEVTYNTGMPNNDGLFATEGISVIKGLSVISTGLTEDFARSLYIYPNPTNGKVTIGGITEIDQILVMASDGSVVMRINPYAKGSQVLDLSNLPAGFYQVQIRTSAGTVTRKVLRGQ